MAMPLFSSIRHLSSACSTEIKKSPPVLCEDQGLKGIENQADKTTCPNMILRETVNL
jgi:hypothetical protein